MKYNKIVKDRLDEYIEFNSDELFYKGDARVFGGSVRDSIAGMDIHDVDIMCGSETNKFLTELLIEKGYIKLDKLSSIDMSSVYKDLKIINEPITFMKNGKFIQLIRPSINLRSESNSKSNSKSNSDSNYNRYVVYDRITELIRGVDISCCGVGYDKFGVREYYIDAIYHCECKVFETNDSQIMRNKVRFFDRVKKLKDRGWEELKEDITKERYEREKNINQLIF